MGILSKLLEKKGIENPIDLSPDEKQDFDRWQRILSEGDISVEKITQFCKAQRSAISTELDKFENSKDKNERLILIDRVYSKLLGLIERPAAEKEALEKHLNKLILDSSE